MPKLVYNGPHAAVEVPAAGIVAERGVPVDVPDAAAKSLLEQDTWTEDKPAVKKNGSK